MLHQYLLPYLSSSLSLCKQVGTALWEAPGTAIDGFAEGFRHTPKRLGHDATPQQHFQQHDPHATPQQRHQPNQYSQHGQRATSQQRHALHGPLPQPPPTAPQRSAQTEGFV